MTCTYYLTSINRKEATKLFSDRLKEHAKICRIGYEEDSIVLEIFITKMNDFDTQKELRRETVNNIKALEKPAHMEIEIKNQQNQNWTIIQTANLFNRSQNRNRKRNYRQRRQIFDYKTRIPIKKFNKLKFLITVEFTDKGEATIIN